MISIISELCSGPHQWKPFGFVKSDKSCSNVVDLGTEPYEHSELYEIKECVEHFESISRQGHLMILLVTVRIPFPVQANGLMPGPCTDNILHDDIIKWKKIRVTGPLWGESTGYRWMPLTKASDAELWCFLWSAPEQTVERTIETLVIWDAIALIMKSL